MIKKTSNFLLFIPLIVFALIGQAQTMEKGESKEIRLVSDTSIIVTSVKEPWFLISTNTKTPYFWYQGREIHSNLGGIGGPLLNGKYYCYTKENQLVEQGKFRRGRKISVWKKWDLNGNLLEVSHWRKGRLHGKYYHYQKDSIDIEKYRNGRIINKPWYIPSFLVRNSKTEDKEAEIKEQETQPSNNQTN